MKHIVLQTDDLSQLSIDPAKTIFWVGAGASGMKPCSLPLGNSLTKEVMEAALGKKNADTLSRLWGTRIPRIRDSIQNGDWIVPGHAKKPSGRDWPRLEFVIGELHKLDIEFQNIAFQNSDNQKIYGRTSVVKSLRHFSSAEPNLYHYALADFARGGAEVVTTNFDVCIEKALIGTGAVPSPEESYGAKAVKYGGGRFVYHVHGIAADKDIESNLGATLTNVSKSLPRQFAGQLRKWFSDGYTIVFIGYGGVDFFDIKPFFDNLRAGEFPGKAIYLQYCGDTVNRETVDRKKHYQYLLTPFREQVICYGDTEMFLKNLTVNSGMRWKNRTLSKDEGHAFGNMKAELSEAFAGRPKEAQDTYWFLNTFRIASQLNINPKWFYPDWAERLEKIYTDWKEDARDTLRRMVLGPEDIARCVVDDIRQNNWGSQNRAYLKIARDIRTIFAERNGAILRLPEVNRDTLPGQVSEVCRILETEDASSPAAALECAVIQYICGPKISVLFKKWTLNPLRRRAIEQDLLEVRGYIDRLLQYPYNHFSYMTFYLTLCRRRHLFNTMLQGKYADPRASSTGPEDTYNPRTKCYGDLQSEWNICMEVPDLFDARKIIKGLLLQYLCRLARLKPFNPLRVLRLLRIRRNIIALLKD